MDTFNPNRSIQKISTSHWEKMYQQKMLGKFISIHTHTHTYTHVRMFNDIGRKHIKNTSA
jgi:hypothetical protein